MLALKSLACKCIASAIINRIKTNSAWTSKDKTNKLKSWI